MPARNRRRQEHQIDGGSDAIVSGSARMLGPREDNEGPTVAAIVTTPPHLPCGAVGELDARMPLFSLDDFGGAAASSHDVDAPLQLVDPLGRFDVHAQLAAYFAAGGASSAERESSAGGASSAERESSASGAAHARAQRTGSPSSSGSSSSSSSTPFSGSSAVRIVDDRIPHVAIPWSDDLHPNLNVAPANFLSREERMGDAALLPNRSATISLLNPPQRAGAVADELAGLGWNPLSSTFDLLDDALSARLAATATAAVGAVGRQSSGGDSGEGEGEGVLQKPQAGSLDSFLINSEGSGNAAGAVGLDLAISSRAHSHALATLPDVVSTTSDLRQLILSPFDPAPRGFVLHRIGPSLIVEGVAANRAAHTAQHARRRTLKSKLLYYSILAAETESESRRHRLGSSRGFAGPLAAAAAARQQGRAQQHQRGGPGTTQRAHDHISARDGGDGGGGEAGGRDGSGTPPEEPRPFSRALHWRFDDINVLLGVTTPVVKHRITGEESTMQVLDADGFISKLDALEFWLDNVMASISSVALCFHRDGVVQGYQVVSTEDIPNLTAHSFEPLAVQKHASKMLHWLKSSCSEEGGSYVLLKDPETHELKLYDLSSLHSGKAAAAATTTSGANSSSSSSSNAARGAGKRQARPLADIDEEGDQHHHHHHQQQQSQSRPARQTPFRAFRMPLALMCYRMSQCLDASDAETPRLLHRVIEMLRDDNAASLVPLVDCHTRCMQYYHSSSPLPDAEAMALHHGRRAVECLQLLHAEAERERHQQRRERTQLGHVPDLTDDERAAELSALSEAEELLAEACAEAVDRTNAVVKCMCSLALQHVKDGQNLNAFVDAVQVAQSAILLRRDVLPSGLITARPQSAAVSPTQSTLQPQSSSVPPPPLPHGGLLDESDPPADIAAAAPAPAASSSGSGAHDPPPPFTTAFQRRAAHQRRETTAGVVALETLLGDLFHALMTRLERRVVLAAATGDGGTSPASSGAKAAAESVSALLGAVERAGKCAIIAPRLRRHTTNSSCTCCDPGEFPLVRSIAAQLLAPPDHLDFLGRLADLRLVLTPQLHQLPAGAQGHDVAAWVRTGMSSCEELLDRGMLSYTRALECAGNIPGESLVRRGFFGTTTTTTTEAVGTAAHGGTQPPATKFASTTRELRRRIGGLLTIAGVTYMTAATAITKAQLRRPPSGVPTPATELSSPQLEADAAVACPSGVSAAVSCDIQDSALERALAHFTASRNIFHDAHDPANVLMMAVNVSKALSSRARCAASASMSTPTAGESRGLSATSTDSNRRLSDTERGNLIAAMNTLLELIFSTTFRQVLQDFEKMRTDAYQECATSESTELLQRWWCDPRLPRVCEDGAIAHAVAQVHNDVLETALSSLVQAVLVFLARLVQSFSCSSSTSTSSAEVPAAATRPLSVCEFVEYKCLLAIADHAVGAMASLAATRHSSAKVPAAVTIKIHRWRQCVAFAWSNLLLVLSGAGTTIAAEQAHFLSEDRLGRVLALSQPLAASVRGQLAELTAATAKLFSHATADELAAVISVPMRVSFSCALTQQEQRLVPPAAAKKYISFTRKEVLPRIAALLGTTAAGSETGASNSSIGSGPLAPAMSFLATSTALVEVYLSLSARSEPRAAERIESVERALTTLCRDAAKCVSAVAEPPAPAGGAAAAVVGPLQLALLFLAQRITAQTASALKILLHEALLNAAAAASTKKLKSSLHMCLTLSTANANAALIGGAANRRTLAGVFAEIRDMMESIRALFHN